VRGLHRPDACFQPIEERQIVGVAAKQRLAQMNVRLNEPGQQVTAAAVDRAIDVVFAKRTDGDDAAVAHEDIAFDHLKGIVHRDDRRSRNF
jgi:hypothetical protein